MVAVFILPPLMIDIFETNGENRESCIRTGSDISQHSKEKSKRGISAGKGTVHIKRVTISNHVQGKRKICRK
jgi:hypothetical protein